MVRHTRKWRILRKKTKKQRGGVLSNAQKAAMSGLGGLFSGPRKAPPQAPPANVGEQVAPPANDPLVIYRKMLSMGQPEGGIIQKMLKNGKNPKNLFPGYGASEAPVVSEGFTLDELRDLKDYVGRSEIIVRLIKLGFNPTELYPEITPDEIAVIMEEYSKPVTAPLALPVVHLGEPQNMKSALAAAVKKRAPINAVKVDIEKYKDFTPEEEEVLNKLDAAKERIDYIETKEIDFAKKQIEKLEKKRMVKDFNLRKILELLKEKRNLEATILTLETPLLKNKYEFSKQGARLLRRTKDNDGPLPRGWIFIVDSEDKSTYYENKYTFENTAIRPTEEAFPPELPEGWVMGEDEISAWYVNTLTKKGQWEVPTKPAEDPLVTSGWTKLGRDNSYVWFQPLNNTHTYNTEEKWYRLRDVNDNLWFENTTISPIKKFNKPPRLGQPDNVTNSWMTL